MRGRVERGFERRGDEEESGKWVGRRGKRLA